MWLNETGWTIYYSQYGSSWSPASNVTTSGSMVSGSASFNGYGEGFYVRCTKNNMTYYYKVNCSYNNVIGTKSSASGSNSFSQ